MSCTWPRCKCAPGDPERAAIACFQTFCRVEGYNCEDKELRESFIKDWHKQRKKEARNGRKTVPKDFLRHLN